MNNKIIWQPNPGPQSAFLASPARLLSCLEKTALPFSGLAVIDDEFEARMLVLSDLKSFSRGMIVAILLPHLQGKSR